MLAEWMAALDDRFWLAFFRWKSIPRVDFSCHVKEKVEFWQVSAGFHPVIGLVGLRYQALLLSQSPQGFNLLTTFTFSLSSLVIKCLQKWSTPHLMGIPFDVSVIFSFNSPHIHQLGE